MAITGNILQILCFIYKHQSIFLLFPWPIRRTILGFPSKKKSYIKYGKSGWKDILPLLSSLTIRETAMILFLRRSTRGQSR